MRNITFWGNHYCACIFERQGADKDGQEQPQFKEHTHGIGGD